MALLTGVFPNYYSYIYNMKKRRAIFTIQRIPLLKTASSRSKASTHKSVHDARSYDYERIDDMRLLRNAARRSINIETDREAWR